jgi:hypothetical protein
MNVPDDLSARLTALIEDQERLFEIIRKENTQLIRMSLRTPSGLPVKSKLQ